MRGLTDTERSFLLDCFGPFEVDGPIVSEDEEEVGERLSARGLLCNHVEFAPDGCTYAEFYRTTPLGRLALDLDALARSCLVPV